LESNVSSAPDATTLKKFFLFPYISGIIGTMELSFQQIFATQPIMGVTINTVFLSPSFRQLVYILIGLIVVLGMTVLLMRGAPFAAALKKAIMVALFTSGIVYAVHADIGWSAWLANDARTYAGLRTEDKLLKMEGGLYDFARRARDIIRDDYMVFSTDDYLPHRMEYFLLPLRKRTQAQYIIVIVDRQAEYDQTKGIFTRGDIVISDVELLFSYANDVYILKRRSL